MPASTPSSTADFAWLHRGDGPAAARAAFWFGFRLAGRGELGAPRAAEQEAVMWALLALLDGGATGAEVIREAERLTASSPTADRQLVLGVVQLHVVRGAGSDVADPSKDPEDNDRLLPGPSSRNLKSRVPNSFRAPMTGRTSSTNRGGSHAERHDIGTVEARSERRSAGRGRASAGRCPRRSGTARRVWNLRRSAGCEAVPGRQSAGNGQSRSQRTGEANAQALSAPERLRAFPSLSWKIPK
jgi:hypothetical protein